MGFGTLIQRITFKISGRSMASSGLYTPQDYVYDYAVGGVPFLSATSDTRPDTEKPVQQRKQQFDNYKDPGEYSLNQWWLRSQTSFIGGAGITYQDPDTQGVSKNIRYNKSIGIDAFSDPDNLQLLRRMVDTGASSSDSVIGPTYIQAFTSTNTDFLWVAKGRTVYSYTVNTGSLTLNGSVLLPLSATSQAILGGLPSIDDRSTNIVKNYAFVQYVDTNVAANSGIYRIDNAGVTATRIYVLPTTLVDSFLGKARGLLAYSRTSSLYMLDPYAAANTALPTANAIVPLDQEIVSITDGPDGVYVAANSGTEGYIYRTTFSNTGAVNGLTLTAILPDGEKINSISSYLNTFLVISTETGIRVGTFTGSGIVYGPSLITVNSTGNTFKGFGRIAFHGDLAFVATMGPPQHDGNAGLIAINLSVLQNDVNSGVNTQFNAYSTWTYFDTSTDAVQDVTVTRSGRTVMSSGYGVLDHVYLEHGTELLPSGYLDTGRCRFNTVEPKLFKYFSVRTPTPLDGDLSVALIDDTGGITPYITYGPTLDPGVNDIATPTPGGPRNYESLRFTLKRGSNLSLGARLDSWQIKAFPGTLKQRVITRQFLCFNSEKDKSGALVFGDTSALDRLTAIRQMCQRGDTVTLQDLVNNIADQVIIDDYQFTMLAPPGPNGENYGGYLTVIMRTVADSVPPVSLVGGVDPE